jgi:hypothetical protein
LRYMESNLRPASKSWKVIVAMRGLYRFDVLSHK